MPGKAKRWALVSPFFCFPTSLLGTRPVTCHPHFVFRKRTRDLGGQGGRGYRLPWAQCVQGHWVQPPGDFHPQFETFSLLIWGPLGPASLIPKWPVTHVFFFNMKPTAPPFCYLLRPIRKQREMLFPVAVVILMVFTGGWRCQFRKLKQSPDRSLPTLPAGEGAF